MKDDKICFPKTLTYLVLLVVALIGGFWVMNYVNKQKLGTNPEAAGGCTTVKIRVINGKTENGRDACKRLAESYNTPFTYKPNRILKGFYCCIPEKQDENKITKGNDCKQAGGTDWYNMDKKTFQTKWSTNYLVDVIDKTSSVSQYYKDQYKDKHCLFVGKMKRRQTCGEVNGEWVNGTCNDAEVRNPNFIYTQVTDPSSSQLAGYKDGRQCCIKDVQYKKKDME